MTFTDLRIERESWPALKTSLPLGQLPMLEVEGATIGQSMAIARYCARRWPGGQGDRTNLFLAGTASLAPRTWRPPWQIRSVQSDPYLVTGLL